jgi:elongation factor Ts
MSEVTAEQVRTLRDKTGAGFMDCKRALAENNGDVDQAMQFLREKGLAAAAKRASRSASEGAVSSYVHAGGKIGVLVEINCETDFVARTDEFQALVKDIAMQIAASSPQYVQREEVPEQAVENEKKIFRVQASESGKPEQVIEKMVEGKLSKFFAEVCLLEQPYIKDPSRTIAQLVTDAVAKIGENIVVRRFARFQLGEMTN